MHHDGLNKQIEIVKELEQVTDRELTPEEMKILAIWQASQQRFAQWKEGGGDYSAIQTTWEALDRILEPERAVEDVHDLAKRIAGCLHFTKTRGARNVLDLDKVSSFTRRLE